MPTTTKSSNKVECINPNTGSRMNIDASTHHLFSSAIQYSLKDDRALTFTQMVKGIHDYFKKQKIKFNGSVEWYAVTIKNDLKSRGVIEVFTEKGKKLHRLSK